MAQQNSLAGGPPLPLGEVPSNDGRNAGHNEEPDTLKQAHTISPTFRVTLCGAGCKSFWISSP